MAAFYIWGRFIFSTGITIVSEQLPLQLLYKSLHCNFSVLNCIRYPHICLLRMIVYKESCAGRWSCRSWFIKKLTLYWSLYVNDLLSQPPVRQSVYRLVYWTTGIHQPAQGQFSTVMGCQYRVLNPLVPLFSGGLTYYCHSWDWIPLSGFFVALYSLRNKW